MAFLDVFLGRRLEDPEDEFDEQEATDLPLHIRQCGRRYRSLDAKLNLVVRLMLLLCGLYVFNNLTTMKTLLGF